MRRFGVFVGVNNYKDYTPLHGAVNDAKILAQHLDFNESRILVDEEATEENILTAVQNLCRDLSENDIFVFFFSGHGKETAGQQYLASYDSELSIRDITQATNYLGVRRLFIVDACRISYSGTYNQSEDEDDTEGVIPPVTITSCCHGQYSLEGKNQMGVFTQSLIETLLKKTVHSFSDFRDELQKINSDFHQIFWMEGPMLDIPLMKSWEFQQKKEKSADDLYNLGMIYSRGIRDIDIDEALLNFMCAAEMGHVDACRQAGLIALYEKHDTETGLQYLKNAAAKKSAEAMVDLGNYYERKRDEFIEQHDPNEEGVAYLSNSSHIAKCKKWNEQAICWFRKASLQGNPEANYHLGLYYENGIWVRRNPAYAEQYYRTAAEGGNPDAQCALGMIYWDQDKNSEAHKLFMKAAVQGHAEAQFALGSWYEVEEDNEKAIHWYKLAAQQGITEAADRLNNIQS